LNAFALGVLPLAVVIDWIFGEPPAALHPVVWMGKAVALGERIAPGRGRAGPFAAGVAMAVVVPSVFATGAWALQAWLRPRGLAGIACGALALKAMFALHGLGREARGMREAIDAGAIDEARARLRALCSRDASALDASALTAATIESIAENASDSFVAPVFWFALLGLPGAAFYRTVNTLDAMIGYRGRYEWLGKASARLDDLLNWIPARITAALLLAGGAATGLDPRRGARILARDGARTESPNAGRPMAAMAGLLGLELTKAGHYRLGDPIEPLAPAQIDRAWRAVCAAALLALAGALALVEARDVFFA
jgi:adenosylcobinamide-phosphate synthase